MQVGAYVEAADVHTDDCGVVALARRCNGWHFRRRAGLRNGSRRHENGNDRGDQRERARLYLSLNRDDGLGRWRSWLGR
jgi:hypothetical protein